MPFNDSATEEAQTAAPAPAGRTTEAEGECAEATDAAGPSEMVGALKVLVIDDDEWVRRLICMLLSRGGGYETIEAADGPAGIEAFKANEFAAVVTDLVMPGLSGCQTIAQIRALNPLVPIIAVSGLFWDPKDEMRNQAIAAGADRVLGKPFRDHELLSMIVELLRLRSDEQGRGTRA